MIFRLFKGQQDVGTDPVGVLEGLEAGSVFLPFRMAEVVRHPAQGQDQVIKRQLFRGKLEGLSGQIDGFRLVEEDGDIAAVGQDGPDGLGDIRIRKAGRGELVEEGLKEVMIVAIDQGDVRPVARE